MATPAEIRQQVQQWLTNLWSHIQNRQENYLAAHGRYFQGLRTHVVIPLEGAEAAPDAIADKPTDQAEGWADQFTLPAAFPCQLRINTYDGPLGKGYVGIVRVRIGGETWERRQNNGPEVWRTVPWTQL